MIILRQKQFNIAQEFYHSGGSRVMKKYAGRLQRKIGKKLEDLSVKQVSNNSEVLKLAKDLEKESISNKKLGKDLVKDAIKKGNSRVFDNNKIQTSIGEKESINYYAPFKPEEAKEVSKRFLNNSKYEGNVDGKRLSKKIALTLPPNEVSGLSPRSGLINIKGKYDENIPALAHEVGHAMNSTGAAGERNKAISRLNLMNKSKKKSEIGTIERVKEEFKRNSAELKEEKNAWKNGINLMKEHGASKEEIKLAEKDKKLSLKTYKAARNARTLNAAAKYLDPNSALKKEVSPGKLHRIKNTYPENLDKNDLDLKNKLDKREIRQNRRKDKSIIGQIFGNSKKRK